MLAQIGRALQLLALVLGAGADLGGVLSGVALEALSLSLQGLEEVERAWGARGEAGVAVHARGALGAAGGLVLGAGLEGVRVLGALHAGLKTIKKALANFLAKANIYI